MQKGSALPLVLFAILILIVGVGGYYFYHYDNSNPVPDPTPSPSPSQNSTNNWEAYLSDKFSFTYPGVAQVTKYENQTTLSYKEPGSPDGCEMCYGYTIYFIPGNLNGQTLNKFVAQKYAQVQANKDIQINEPLAPIKIGENYGFAYKAGIQRITQKIYLENGNGGYIEIDQDFDDPKNIGYQQITDKILSSFKFSDNESANWKTYENKDLQYSIKYPSEIFVQHKCLRAELLLQRRSVGEQRDIVDDEESCLGDSRFTVEIITPMGEVDEPKTDEYYEVKKESVLIDGVKGAKFTIFDKTDNGRWVGVEVFIKKNRLHRIWLNDKELLPVFDQMLTTFKFLK